MLKHYHHITVDTGFKQDCQVWKIFLNSNSLNLCTPFVDFSPEVQVKPLFFYSDASLNKNFGFGAVFNDRWIFSRWGATFIEQASPSIEFLELYALCLAIFTWEDIPKLNNSRVAIYCNNQVVLNIVNNMTSRCPKCMHLVRLLVFNCIMHNRKISVRFVRSKDNNLADSLSRMDFKCFWKFAPHFMKPFTDALPLQYWPIQKVWDLSLK